MKYNILALDLDGTLTNSKKEVSIQNIKYINYAIDAGVQIVLASGRPTLGIEHVAQTLGLDEKGGFILAYNGGQIIECRSHQLIVHKVIPYEYNHLICETARRFNVCALTYNDIGVISENDNDPYVIKEGYNNSIPVIKVDCLEKEIKAEVVKFMIVGEHTQLIKVKEYLSIEMKDKLNVFFSEPYFLEITPLGIEKSSSMKKLLDYLGYSRDQLIVCGDGLNDISMMKLAGFSVAMENAYEETKKYADYITASNENDGVAEAIDKFILSENI